MGGEQHGLPCRAFVAFAIAQQTKRSLRSAFQLRRKRHARCERKAVTQGSGGYFDARQFMCYVSAQDGAILIVRGQFFNAEELALGERRVQSRARVALTEYE